MTLDITLRPERLLHNELELRLPVPVAKTS